MPEMVFLDPHGLNEVLDLHAVALRGRVQREDATPLADQVGARLEVNKQPDLANERIVSLQRRNSGNCRTVWASFPRHLLAQDLRAEGGTADASATREVAVGSNGVATTGPEPPTSSVGKTPSATMAFAPFFFFLFFGFFLASTSMRSAP